MQHDTSPASSEPGLSELLQQSFAYAKDLAHLAKLEACLSMQSIALVAILGLSAIFLAFSTWLLILSVIVTSLLSIACPLIGALLVAAGLSLLIALLCFLAIRRLMRKIGLPKTFQQLSEIIERTSKHD